MNEKKNLIWTVKKKENDDELFGRDLEILFQNI
jgi:hypothetical protein